jgi:hypothetical protein
LSAWPPPAACTHSRTHTNESIRARDSASTDRVITRCVYGAACTDWAATHTSGGIAHGHGTTTRSVTRTEGCTPQAAAAASMAFPAAHPLAPVCTQVHTLRPRAQR